MMRKISFGRSNLSVSKLWYGGVVFGVADPAADWDPFSKRGRAEAIRLIHLAFERGIMTYDTSPDYGDGHSEGLLGEALADRRDQVVIATKVDYSGQTADDVTRSVDASLRRLCTDYLDLVQFHGGNYPPSSVKRIMDKGLLDALMKLKEAGRIKHIGLTVSDPVTARPLIESGAFDTVQLNYSLIEQAAARHALNWCAERNLGVTVMRPLGAGMLVPLFEALEPSWADPKKLAEICLKFLLSDSRVHTINVGMRTSQEIETNAGVVEAFTPTLDIRDLPRSVGQIARQNAKLKKLFGR